MQGMRVESLVGQLSSHMTTEPTFSTAHSPQLFNLKPQQKAWAAKKKKKIFKKEWGFRLLQEEDKDA